MRYWPELDANLGRFGQETLSGAEIERHILPTPIVDKKLNGSKRFGRRLGGYTGLFTVADNFFPLKSAGPILTPDSKLIDSPFGYLPSCAEHIHFLIADFVSIKINHWLHSD